jgi:Putative zinc-finger
MTCEEFATQLASYANGTLTAAECESLELHASMCSACESLMERATAGRFPAFAPDLPADLRAQVLTAVAARRRASRVTHWTRAAAVIGAAALIALMLRPTGKQGQTIVADSTSAATAARSRSPADDLSRSEFIALDEAARELETAIARAPDDKQLSIFLQTVTEQRAELQRRVKDARS